jgi:hypothetical protein
MGRSSTQRKRADEFLLAAEGDGWIEREVVIREMMRYVLNGQAHRTAAAKRQGTNEDEPRRRDSLRVGSRHVANATFQNALRHGAWVRDGSRVRHRDHPGRPAPTAVISGWAVPALDDVRDHLASLDWLRGLTSWHWAAVILAHVEVADGPGQSAKVKSDLCLTAVEFAGLGIPGLKSKNTLRRYHKIALDHWGSKLQPGEPVEIPDPTTWPTARQNHNPGTRPRPPRVRIDSQDSVVHGAIECFGSDAADKLHTYANEAARRTHKQRRQRLKVVTA